MTAFSTNTNTLPIKILILGKQNSGKTYMLYSWKYGIDYIMSIEPTSHFNVETIISASGRKYLVYDLAGNIGLRLRPFLDGTNGIIYMLGTRGDDFLCNDEEEYIIKLLQERDLEDVPILFVIRDGFKNNDCLQDLSLKLCSALEGKIWDIMEIKENSQAETDLVISVLEKLLSKSYSWNS
ncbi:Arf GTPase arf1 [Bulinus truncatus]|nr:Arf GTPase arf1 [Bulinus truncatus]